MQTNFLVIGSGISGLNFALHAAEKGKVILVTKKKLIDANTNYAQGGIAAVLDKYDSYKNHVKDTLTAGAFHNDKKAVEFMVKNSAPAIHRLISLGVKFEKERGKDSLALTREGGHHHQRIAFVGDYTGREIERILVERVKENKNILILEDTFALKLITKNSNRTKICFGAQVIRKNKIENIFADQTILATGGLGQIFKYTTNPPIATGDGIALGIEAKCKIKDMEFIQFHPTALAKNISPMFLISETVRGEGAKLINAKKEHFMEHRHPLKDLAPRDIVAREIYKEQKYGPVYLDISHRDKKFLQKRFPQIYKKLKEQGIDMAKDKIPVTPAAHYLCGGIVTDLNGKTNVKNLFAFGEVTCTGVHGANRLASNSLLEAVVFSNKIVKKLKVKNNHSQKEFPLPKLIPQNSKETFLAGKLKKQIQSLMWDYVGINRNTQKIKNEGIPQIKKILEEIQKIEKHGTNKTIAEVKNMAVVTHIILKAAYARKKSLGCHFITPKK